MRNGDAQETYAMEDSTERTVAIIGAGSAGLTAAEALRENGYTNVVLFERASRAGGKCSNVDIDGRNYELGAGIIAECNTEVMALARRYHVPFEKAKFGKSVDVDAYTGAVLPKLSLSKKLRALWQLMFRYHALVAKNPHVNAAGLAHLPIDLTQPLSTWARVHGIETLVDQLSGFFTGYGYGYVEHVPAIYALKYFSWGAVRSFARRTIYTFPNGIQNLWETVARQHTVRYNIEVTSIERSDAGVTIHTHAGQDQFDALIITSPLDEILRCIDSTAEEKALFTNIRYIDYRTYACRLNNFPAASGYVPGNYTPERKGHPVFWYQRYEETNVYTFYCIADDTFSDEHAIRNIEQLVNAMGGTVEGTEIQMHWKYFPHVTPQQIQDGYFDRLEEQQGRRNTYYAGEFMNFSTVGLTAQYAHNLVQRFFPPKK